MKPISTGTAPHHAWCAKYDGWHLVRSADLSAIQVFVVATQPNSHGDRIPA
jgi:hypothetical protein